MLCEESMMMCELVDIQIRRINIGNKGQVWTGVCLLVNSCASVLCVVRGQM